MDETKTQILVVDDDVALLGVMETSLQMKPEYSVEVTNNASNALKLIDQGFFDVVVSDYSLGDPEIDGLDILREAKKRNEACQCITITAYASLEISLQAIRLGAYDFLTKPFQLDELNLTVGNAAEKVRLNKENIELRSHIGEMSDSIQQIREDHGALMGELNMMKERGLQRGPTGAIPHSRPEAKTRVQAYLKMGATIGDQLEHEHDKLKNLFDKGLITEPTYRKGTQRRVV